MEINEVAELVERTLSGVDLSVESQNVVGEKIVNKKGQMAIPVNSVTVVAMSGGGEYGDVKIIPKKGDRFAGGSVTIKSIKPQYFLIDNGNGFTVTTGMDPLLMLVGVVKDVAEKLKK